MKTTVPAEEIPIIIIHWKVLAYPNTSVFELRKFLEPRLKRHPVDDKILKIWVREARAWVKSEPRRIVESLLNDYHRVRLIPS